jgi:hypothetical protein
MAAQMNKSELLAAIQREHDRLKETINYLSEAQMVTPGLYSDNSWTAKDILTHVVAWEQLQVGWMQAKREQRPLNPPTSAMWQGTAALNEQFNARYKDYPLEQAWAEFDSSFQDIVSELEALPDEALADPTPYGPDHRATTLCAYRGEHLRTLPRTHNRAVGLA